MRGLNFYYPTAGMTLMRNFHGTTPLIVQNGGSLYAKTAPNGTAIGNEKSVNGFTKLTDLFTVYNMPVNVDNSISISEMVICLSELRIMQHLICLQMRLLNFQVLGKLHLSQVLQKSDGTIDRSVCGCAESSVIF